MHHCCGNPHCHWCHGGHAGWFDPYRAYPAPPPCMPPPHAPPRDDYVRRLEAERDSLERRLRRVEEQLAELVSQKRGG